MHRMFCDSALRALAAEASEERVERVVHAVHRDGCHLDDLPPVDRARLLTFCACLLDVGAWEDLVRATETAALNVSERPEIARLELLTSSLQHLEVGSDTEGCPRGFEGEWRRRVQRSFARLQQVLASPKHWESIVDEQGVMARIRSAEGQCFIHVQTEIPWDDDAGASPSELFLRASAMLRALSESEHMQVRKILGKHDAIMEYDPDAEDAAGSSLGVLERVLTKLTGKFAVRQIVTPLPDGCQCIQFEWDIERDEALHLDRADELLSNLLLLKFSYDEPKHCWRFSLADVAPIAPPEWLSSSRLLHAPLLALLRLSASPTIRRMLGTLREHLNSTPLANVAKVSAMAITPDVASRSIVAGGE